jgi:predicted DCC family thiol-disulfide oxidoreductase YuxK
MNNGHHSIILFDGVCNLCNQSVQFIIKRDKKDYFRFAALQSEIGTDLLQQYHVSPQSDSIVFIDNGKAYTKSSAALRICKGLSGLWPLMYAFIIIPPFLRNSIYNWIARNRYRWFGKKNACMIPTPALKSKFL